MLVGVPASGKSTWVKDNVGDCVVISSDNHIEILAEQQGKTYSEVFNEAIVQASRLMREDLAEALIEKKNIIWDQTNLTEKSRRKKMKQVPKDYEKIAVFFPTPSEDELKKRLDSRPGKFIPKGVINNMIDTMQTPTKEEGFSTIIIANNGCR